MATNYDDAREDFRSITGELKKDVNEFAREEKRIVNEAANAGIRNINDELRQIENVERSIGDEHSRDNIRKAREAAREARENVNIDASIAREDIDDEVNNFKSGLADAKKEIRDAALAGTVYHKAGKLAVDAMEAKDNIDEAMLEALYSMNGRI